jgi:hypothetical protein
MDKHTSIIIVAAVGCLGIVHASLGDVYEFRTVAMTGDPAPGSFNGVFTEFGVPSINSNGLVAFAAKTNASSVTSGMWMTPPNAPNTIGFVVGKDWPAPGTPGGVTFGNFSMQEDRAPLINELGNVAIYAPLQGIGGDAVHGLFRRIDGTVTKVLIPGDQAPGASAGTVIKALEYPSFNNQNLMAFRAQFEGTGVVGGVNDIAQYIHWFGGLTMVHRGGWSAPGMPGTTFGNSFSFRAQIADNGRTSIQCPMIEDGQETTSHWTGWPAALEMLARGGDLSPVGLPYGGANTFSGGTVTQDGMVFARQVINGGSGYSGLWYHNGQWTEAVAYSSGPGPIGAYTTIYPESAMAAANGTTVFRAKFNQPVNSDTAIVRKTPGQAPVVVVRENDPVYPWGTIQFDDLGNQNKVMNDNIGRTYIIAKVRGPGVNAGNDEGMWVREPNGDWHFVIRRGQYMALEDGVFRIVDTFAVLPGYGMESGFRPGVNNNGDIAMRINFTDGVSAIVVAELPGCLGDINGDGVVDGLDLLILLSAWGQCFNCDADLNDDGVVDGLDLLILLSAWGVCP